MAEVIELQFLADMQGILKDLQKAQNVSDKTVKRIFKDLKIAHRAARREAKKTAREAQKSAKRIESGLQAVKEIAEGFGGAIGGAAGMLEKFGKGAFEAGSAIGPLGLGTVAAGVALTGLGVAAVGATAAIVALVDSADGLISETQRFDDVFGATGPEQVDAIHGVADSIDALGVVVHRAHVLIAAELAPAMEGAARHAVALGIAATQASDSIVAMAERAGEAVLRGLGPVAWLAVAATTDAAADYADAADVLIDRLRDEKDAEQAAASARTDGANAARDAAAAERERAAVLRELERALAAEEQATAQAAEVSYEASSELLTAAERDAHAWAIRAEELEELAAATGGAYTALELLSAEQERAARDAAAAESELYSATMEDADKLQSMFQALQSEMGAWILASVDGALAHLQEVGSVATDLVTTFSSIRIDKLEEEAAREKEHAQARADRWRDAQTAQVEWLAEVGKLSEAQADAELRRIDEEYRARSKAAEKAAKDEQRQARKAFRASQALQIAAATVESIRAGISLIPSFAYLGPGAPAAAAAVAAAAETTAVAQILATEPPTFAFGGVVGDRARAGDHVPILASPQEGIVSAAAMQRIGRDGLDAINSAQGALSAVTMVSIDGQVIARRVARAIRSDAETRAALDLRDGLPTGIALVYGRGG